MARVVAAQRLFKTQSPRALTNIGHTKPFLFNNQGAGTSVTLYDLVMSAATGGTATPVGTNAYAASAVVPIEATADAGYTFARWTGADVSTIADVNVSSTTITMTDDFTIAPLFYLTPVVDYITAVESKAGAEALSNTVKDALNVWWATAVSKGYSGNIMRCVPGLTANAIEEAAQVDFITPTTNDIAFVNAPTQDALIGVTFDGTTQYATTGFVPSTEFAAVDNYQIYAYNITAPTTAAAKRIIGNNSSTSRRIYLSSFDASSKRSGLGLLNAISVTSPLNAASREGVALSRSSATRLDLFINGVSVANNTTLDTGTLPAVEFYYGASNNAGPAAYTNGTWCFMVIAENMTDTNMLDLHTDIAAFLTTIGAI